MFCCLDVETRAIRTSPTFCHYFNYFAWELKVMFTQTMDLKHSFLHWIFFINTCNYFFVFVCSTYTSIDNSMKILFLLIYFDHSTTARGLDLSLQSSIHNFSQRCVDINNQLELCIKMFFGADPKRKLVGLGNSS